MKKEHIMTKEKELQLLPDELTWIVLTCPRCKAEQGLDISSESQVEKLQKADRFFNCGICGDGYELPLKQALQSLVLFHEQMKPSKTKVYFRIYIKDEE